MRVPVRMACAVFVLTTAVLAAVVLVPFDADASTLVVPNASASTEANGADQFLPNGPGFQQLFILDKAQFSTLAPGDQITQIALRPDVTLCSGNPCGPFAATTIHNVTIKLATTSIAATDTSDTTIADFLTTSVQTVFSGDVTVSSR